MNSESLTGEDIRRLLSALAEDLEAAGVRAELFLVGGAAMALCYDSRRATRDLDAVFRPTAEVRAAAARIADREGLDPDWLNDAVKGFTPGTDRQAVRFFDSPGLLVDVASAEYLLAMKLFASRVETDAEDIVLLYDLVGYRTVEQGLDLVQRAYPGRPVPARVQFLLEEIVASRPSS